MKAASILLALLLLATAPGTLHAQDNQEAPDIPGFLMFNQNMVPGSDMGTVNQLADSLMRPILDAMVDEGVISNWGILTHSWGDEWNWNWYMFTKDHATFVSAWSEFVERASEANPGSLGQIYGHVTAHKDNTFSVRHFMGRELTEGEDPPRFMMLNQSRVEQKDIGSVNTLVDSLSAPILDAMVDEGLIYFWGAINHSWGDEWNINWYMGTKDHASFVTAWSEFVKRLGEQHPGAFAEFNKYIQAHKDNLYYIQYAK